VTGHLTRRQLEQLVVDDPRAPVPPVLRVHLAGCDRCSVRKLALDGARSRFLTTYPAAEFARAVVARAAIPAPVAPPRRSARHMIAPAAGVFALAAAALVWLYPAIEPGAIRSKGGASLEVVAKRGAIQSPLHDGDALAPGDELAFSYSLDRPKYLLLVGVDDAGEITRYFPADAASDASLAATPRAQLPIGIELDERKGDERLYALFSDGPLDEATVLGAVLRELESVRAKGRGIGAMREIDLAPRVQQITAWFSKP
jgi:hypothetical protein